MNSTGKPAASQHSHKYGGQGVTLSSSFLLEIKRACSFATSGTCRYRTTRYPASVSSLSLAASWLSRPLWLESSSSITAITSKALEHNTKSATFLSKRFRVALSLVSSSAENATCASTWYSGNASKSRKNIVCSRTVSGLRALIDAGFRFFPFFSNAPAIAAITPISKIGKSALFIFVTRNEKSPA